MKLMIADKIEELTRTQVEAVKNLKIDKVTVWDGMNGKEGTSTTSNFLSSMLKSIPPMNEMFQMAGMTLPEFLGKPLNNPGKEGAAGTGAVSAGPAVQQPEREQ